ncbi:hypothetical protein COL27_32730, partial [Bacillus sp. AFS075960]
SPGWLRFFVQLVGASLVLAGLMHWFSISFDWTGMRTQPLERIVLMGACLVLFWCGALHRMRALCLVSIGLC